MRIGRVIVWVVGAAVAAGVVVGVYKTGALSPERAAAPVPTPTVKAKAGDVAETVLASGAVSPVDETQIRAEVSGLVTKVWVTPGERVTKDKQLVELDRKELESEVHEDQFQIEADQLREDQSRKKLDRDRMLVARGSSRRRSTTTPTRPCGWRRTTCPSSGRSSRRSIRRSSRLTSAPRTMGWC